MQNPVENPVEAMPWLNSYPANVDWHAPMPPRPVHTILEDTVRNHGGKPAFDFLGKRTSWAEIGRQVDLLATGLQRLGAKKGMKIGLFLPNCPYFLIGYYAILKTGATVVNYNPLYSPGELVHNIEDSATEIVITADLAMLMDKMTEVAKSTHLKKLVVCSFPDALPLAKRVLFRLFKRKDLARIEHSPLIIPYHDLIATESSFTQPAIDPINDIALIQYTGGTTGAPKGAMLTHQNVGANVEQAALWFPQARPGVDRMLGVIPFFHVFAMTAVMNFSVRCGFEIIATPRFELKPTLKLIARRRPTLFPAVPAIYNAINHAPGEHDLSSLRYCISGGAPLPVEVKRLFEQKAGCVVVEGYGLTESSPIVCVNPLEGENKPGSIGLPVSGTVVRILDPDTHAPMPVGERGELCVIGPQVMKGYLNKPEDTAKVLKDGVLHTGDVAIMDDQGYIFIVDRIKDMIITNGYKVYPRNVEEAIYQHPAVEECIVAGIPDVSRGEIVKAWIKLKTGKTLAAEDVKSFLKEKLSPMEVPRQVEFRDQPLPKTMIGKLSRKDILAEEKARTGQAQDSSQAGVAQAGVAHADGGGGNA